MKPTAAWFLALGLATLVATPAAAADIFVGPTGADGVVKSVCNAPAEPACETDAECGLGETCTEVCGDAGLTCGANVGSPCRTIQHAVLCSSPGDTIRVARGTYNECVSTIKSIVTAGSVTFESRQVAILSDDFDTQGNAASTIIDGTGGGPCSDPVAPSGGVVEVGENSSVTGFTITGGADGGVNAFGAATVSNNVINMNTGDFAGGLFVQTVTEGFVLPPVAVIDSNRITNNTGGFRGGGISVEANGLGSDVSIVDNEILNNTSLTGEGGGIEIQSASSPSPGDSANFVVRGNTITGNSTTLNGGGLLIRTIGSGVETAEIADNTFSTNTAGLFGGGVAVRMVPPQGSTPDHSILVEGNTASANVATQGGGGMDLEMLLKGQPDPGSIRLIARDNEITGNSSTANYAPIPGVSDVCGDDEGGGGLYVNLTSTDTLLGDFQVLENTIRGNTSQSCGGGATVNVVADGETAFAFALVRFANNLLVENHTDNTLNPLPEEPQGSVGTGLHGVMIGNGTVFTFATLEMANLTVVGNTLDGAGSALEMQTYTNAPLVAAGVATLESSIVQENFGMPQVGGGEEDDGDPIPPVRFDVKSNLIFGDSDPNLDDALNTCVSPQCDKEQNINADAILEPGYVPALCSPSIDSGPLLADFSLEPEPNGNRVNLGHTGGTAQAVITLPDVTADGIVEGIDILRIATSFNSTPADTDRWNAAADLDGDDLVDGNDLAYVCAFFGRPAEGKDAEQCLVPAP